MNSIAAPNKSAWNSRRILSLVACVIFFLLAAQSAWSFLYNGLQILLNWLQMAAQGVDYLSSGNHTLLSLCSPVGELLLYLVLGLLCLALAFDRFPSREQKWALSIALIVAIIFSYIGTIFTMVSIYSTSPYSFGIALTAEQLLLLISSIFILMSWIPLSVGVIWFLFHPGDKIASHCMILFLILYGVALFLALPLLGVTLEALPDEAWILALPRFTVSFLQSLVPPAALVMLTIVMFLFPAAPADSSALSAQDSAPISPAGPLASASPDAVPATAPQAPPVDSPVADAPPSPENPNPPSPPA